MSSLKTHRGFKPQHEMRKSLTIVLIVAICFYVSGQDQEFPESPLDAKFVTSDIELFWTAFDSLEISNKNSFERYLSLGSLGVKGFTENRIESADALKKMAKRKKADYENNRNIESLIKIKEKEIIPYFYGLEFWYPDAVYPPVYFVVGRFNSGGTTSENGLIIGVEKLNGLDDLEELVIHESIHFQQKWPEKNPTLLEQSILEGSADFVAELVTGKHGNKEANDYGNSNKDLLCQEFVTIMNGQNYKDWLYGTSGKDKRPNDLGYWIGYEIVKAYFDKSDNKKLAVRNILNINDFSAFLKESNYLAEYMK